MGKRNRAWKTDEEKEAIRISTQRHWDSLLGDEVSKFIDTMGVDQMSDIIWRAMLDVVGKVDMPKEDVRRDFAKLVCKLLSEGIDERI